MKTTLITIVSEQTIPNVLFIKEMQHKVNGYAFFSTKLMEERGKTSAIKVACSVKEELSETIIIDQDSPFLVRQQLEHWLTSKGDDFHFMVNFTGGTKTTTLIFFNLFSRKQSSFYYMPIGKQNITQLSENFQENTLPLTTRLNLHSYLKAKGLFYNSAENFLFTKSQAFDLFLNYARTGFNINQFPFAQASKFAGFELPKENAPGSWFEEYIYYKTCDSLGLREDAAAMSVFIFIEENQEKNDMEFDLMFVKENVLYVAECKVSMGKQPRKSALIPMQKLSALKNNFGLTTQSFLLTLSDLRLSNGLHSKDIISKCKNLSINNIADNFDFKNNNINLVEFFQTKIYGHE